MKQVTVLGLGEAGARYAADLAALGVKVVGFDPAPVATPKGVERSATIAAAVAGADLVIGFTGAAHAGSAAAEATRALPPGAVYADFNTGSPAVKREVGAALAASAARAADVAVLAPVPRAGARTPLLISGPGAADVADFFSSVVGADAESIGGELGEAASRKLLRSVFMKGLAAVVIEADAAAAAAGQRDWCRQQMAAELGPEGSDFVERLISGTRTHAVRRLHEMQDARGFLDELRVPTDATDAAVAWLDRLASAGERS